MTSQQHLTVQRVLATVAEHPRGIDLSDLRNSVNKKYGVAPDYPGKWKAWVAQLPGIRVEQSMAYLEGPVRTAYSNGHSIMSGTQLKKLLRIVCASSRFVDIKGRLNGEDVIDLLVVEGFIDNNSMGGYVWKVDKIRNEVGSMPKGEVDCALLEKILASVLYKETQHTHSNGFDRQNGSQLAAPRRQIQSRSTCPPLNVNNVKFPVLILSSELEAEMVLAKDSFLLDAIEQEPQSRADIAMHCEVDGDELLLVEIVTPMTCYVIDYVEIGTEECKPVTSLLAEQSILKVFYDLHINGRALRKGAAIPVFRNTFDVQLALELQTGNIFARFNSNLQNTFSVGSTGRWGRHSRFRSRPLNVTELHKSLELTQHLRAEVERLRRTLQTSQFEALQRASDTRAIMEGRQTAFLKEQNYQHMSRELAAEIWPDKGCLGTPLVVNADCVALLQVLPEAVRARLEAIGTDQLSDIVLDKGRPPHCWKAGKRIFLLDEHVTTEDIDYIGSMVNSFGQDNRAILEKQLHRISCIRNRNYDIIGLTFRVGRHVQGNADMIRDLLHHDDTSSILFLGEPGCGKTTAVREATRLLAEDRNVCIVDTSNEIAGDGDVVHECVGHARRMMVPSLNEQANVMIECVQNHTPDVLVIDEIGRSVEVEAARTCKQRGVRMIASAHGNLRKLVKNPKLRGLIGGVESVTLGDAAAKTRSATLHLEGISKIQAQRCGEPVFEIIIEMETQQRHNWCVVFDSAQAVDDILDAKSYVVEKRTRDPISGYVQTSLESR